MFEDYKTMKLFLPMDIRVAPDSIHTYRIHLKRRSNWFEKLDKVFRGVVIEWTENYEQITHLFPFDGFWYFRLKYPTWEQFRDWMAVDYQEKVNTQMLPRPEMDACHMILGWLYDTNGLDYTTVRQLARKMEASETDEGASGIYSDFMVSILTWKHYERMNSNAPQEKQQA